MQDKKSFGKYISEKRKEKNITQEELANKLYVIPSTISKWERGISYPDITVITNLCKELNISEHEFFTACDDEVLNKEKKEIKKYRTIKKWFFNTINIGYLIGLITCLICNVVIDHKISWFLIVLLSILISFTITSLPLYLKNNKYKFCKISAIVTILIYILLFIINYINKGNWLIDSYLIASFVFIFLWISILICTFTKIALYYKISISLFLLSIVTVITNPFCAKVLDISNNTNNIPNVMCALVMILIAIYMSLNQKLSKRD